MDNYWTLITFIIHLMFLHWEAVLVIIVHVAEWFVYVDANLVKVFWFISPLGVAEMLM